MRISHKRIENVLGRAPRPGHVWQQQFDYNQDTLHRLAQTDWDDIPEGLLWAYIHDLSYIELQPDLFAHVFPACLKFWYESMMRDEGADQGDADFHYALIHGEILTKMLNEQQRQNLFDFFVDGFLDRLDMQQGFDYQRGGKSANAWIYRFNSIGLIAPVIEKICSSWWSMETKGQAVSSIMYMSGLVYLKGENPIYMPWTPEDGGGGPYLSEWDASIYDHVWLRSNLEFLKKALTTSQVLDRLEAAVLVLADEPEAKLADKIARQAQDRKDIIEIRTGDLLEDLATMDLQKKYLRDW